MYCVTAVAGQQQNCSSEAHYFYAEQHQAQPIELIIHVIFGNVEEEKKTIKMLSGAIFTCYQWMVTLELSTKNSSLFRAFFSINVHAFFFSFLPTNTPPTNIPLSVQHALLTIFGSSMTQTKVLLNPRLTWLGFKLMASRSPQYISCHYCDACSNHSAISDSYLDYAEYILEPITPGHH